MKIAVTGAMYMPSGWPLTAIPFVLLSRQPVCPVMSRPYASWPPAVRGSAAALAP